MRFIVDPQDATLIRANPRWW